MRRTGRSWRTRRLRNATYLLDALYIQRSIIVCDTGFEAKGLKTPILQIPAYSAGQLTAPLVAGCNYSSALVQHHTQSMVEMRSALFLSQMMALESMPAVNSDLG